MLLVPWGMCSSLVLSAYQIQPRSAMKAEVRGGGRLGGGRVSKTAAKAAVVSSSSYPEAVPDADEAREVMMDQKLASLGVSFYQALMVVFVAMVYAADGAEVTVMSLVAKTLGEKWGLESWERGLLGTSVYSGMFAGGLLCGPVADSKGRSFTLVTATALISIFGILSAYAPSFGTLCLARFIAGVGMGASLPVSSSLLQETVPKRWKGALACLVFAGFNVGELFAAKAGEFAFRRPDPSTWLFLVAALPAVATWLVSLAVPESPRFLASRGNAAGVKQWFQRAARINRKSFETDVFPEVDGKKKDAAYDAAVAQMCSTPMAKRAELETTGVRKPRALTATIKAKVGGIFKPGGLRLKTIVLWILWMAANASFYGLIFSLPQALSTVSAGDPTFDVTKGISKVSALQSISFLVFLPLVALDIPYKVIFPMAFAGATAALIAAVGSTVAFSTLPAPVHLVNCLALAKFFYNGVFMCLYPATGTAYPTAVRATGTALAGTVGRICTILVPPICTRLQDIFALLPYQLFVVTSAAAFFASLLL